MLLIFLACADNEPADTALADTDAVPAETDTAPSDTDTAPGDTDTVPSDTDTAPADTATDTAPVDSDRDGATAEVDCDDADASVHPAAPETCDGRDEDCDGRVDDDATDASAWIIDLDGDGWGADLYAREPYLEWACDAPAGYVALAGDCADEDAAVNPDATEVCNGLDDDCDGDEDEPSAADASTWYADGDGDGYGDAGAAEIACQQPAGAVADATDCDDAAVDVSPAGTEHCDDRDEDCDGAVDDDPADPGTWYTDADGDGHGDPAAAYVGCDQPADAVVDPTDCDDTDGDTNPRAAEVCDGDDDDCDGTVDEDDAVDAVTWYADADGDRFGDSATGVVACDAPPGTVADGTDCSDAEAHVYPGAAERCDGQLNDCGTAWTAADEDGVVTHYTAAGAFIADLTSTFAAGTAAAPAAYTLPATGIVQVCAGHYYMRLNATGSEATVEGLYGYADTIFDGGYTHSVLTVTDGALTVRGVTLQRGGGTTIGGLRHGGGALVYASAASADDTLTLDACSVSDNATEQGGGLYVYGWASVRIVDGLVTNNYAWSTAGGLYIDDDASVELEDTLFNGNMGYSSGCGATIATTGTLTCTGGVGSYGIINSSQMAEIGFATGVRMFAGTLVSNNCDWSNGDLWDGAALHTYGDDETFTCVSGSGCY